MSADKWNRIYEGKTDTPVTCDVLTENVHLLPKTGLALDVACGLGGNAEFLATHGLTVDAWDISEIAIDKLNKRTLETHLPIRASVKDISPADFTSMTYDLILVNHYLDRKLAPAMMRALRAGGMLLYQTFTQTKVSNSGPSNPDYLLERNELLSLFSGLSVVVFRDEQAVGDVEQGSRNQSLLVAQKLISETH